MARTGSVYGSAERQGLRTGLASRYAAAARVARHRRFFAMTKANRSHRILDLGCGSIGLREFEPSLDITGLDRVERPDYPGAFVVADATERLPFDDDQFDLVVANSVIEHIDPTRRAALAAEIRRVGRGWMIQTPAIGFPIEPHSLLPFAHWLPERLRRPYWNLGVSGAWEQIELLSKRDFERLFGPALAERIGPLAKSWVAVTTVDGVEIEPSALR